MDLKFCNFFIILIYLIFYTDSYTCDDSNPNIVHVVISARNKYHLLPYFFHYFENINYPKDKLSLFIRSDHNFGKTIAGLKSWIRINEQKYLSIDFGFEENSKSYDEEEEKDGRKRVIMKFKQDGLERARELRANFVWVLEIDTFHTNPDVLQSLIKQNKTIISPMLTSITPYSNFFGDMTETYKYILSDDYEDIIDYTIKGCFPVALVSESVLINLDHEKSKHLFFQSDRIPVSNPHMNENVILSLIAKEIGIEKYICNDNQYGSVLLPSTWSVNVKNELSQLKKLNVSIQVDNTSQLPKTFSNKTFSYDKIYCINLKRRPERRESMQKKFDELGLKGTFFDAIDWKEFNETYLKSLDIRILKNYDKGDVTLGVIANFLSHYFIWQDIASNRYEKAIILEDDVDFHHDFPEKMEELMEDLERLQLGWELIFLGRRPMKEEVDNKVPDSDILVKPDFSWWLIGYMLSHEGAKKLVDQEPLQKLIPADEYVPIMYDKHPQEKYKKHFNPRNINAFAVYPRILFPTHYKIDEGYVSDTTCAPKVSDTTADDVLMHMKHDMQAFKVEL